MGDIPLTYIQKTTAMPKSKTTWHDDGKHYASKMISSFTLRQGYLRIDYSPTAFGPGAITFTRETSDPTKYLEEITPDQFQKLRSKVLEVLDEIMESNAIDDLPEIHTESYEDEDDEDWVEYESDENWDEDEDVSIISAAEDFFEADFETEVLWDERAILADLSERYKHDPQINSMLRRNLKSPVSSKRKVAATALGHLGVDAETAQSLSYLLADENDDVVNAAANALVAAGSQSVPVLLSLMKHESQEIVSLAAQVLLDVDYEGVAEDVVSQITSYLQKMTECTNQHERTHASMIYAIRGKAHAILGTVSSSVVDFQKAIKLDASTHTGYWAALADIYNIQGNNALATALKWFNEGCEAQEAQEFATAKKCYIRSAKASDEFPWSYNNLAWLLLTCEDVTIRDCAMAIKAAKRACQLNDWQHHQFLDTLATALAESGRFDEAVKTIRKALHNAPDEARGEYEFNLRRYENGLGWAPYEDASEYENDES